jgi:hypothetical protein
LATTDFVFGASIGAFAFRVSVQESRVTQSTTGGGSRFEDVVGEHSVTIDSGAFSRIAITFEDRTTFISIFVSTLMNSRVFARTADRVVICTKRSLGFIRTIFTGITIFINVTDTSLTFSGSSSFFTVFIFDTTDETFRLASI